VTQLRSRALFLATIALATLTSHTVRAADLPTIAETLHGTPFSLEDARTVAAGEIAVTPVDGISDRELVVGIACLMPTGRARELSFDTARPMFPSTLVERFTEIDPKDALPALSKMPLTDRGKKEMRRILEFEPGLGLNVSAEELAAFQRLEQAQPERPDDEAVAEEVRRMLARRARRYREKGLAGIDAYLRAKGREAQPSEELARALAQAHAMEQRFPLFFEYWNRYPQAALPDSHENFFWIQSTIRDRPALLLAHQTSWQDGDAWMIGERHFYVSHFFNGSYAVAFVMPTREGTLFAMMDRLWVDGYSGMAGLKKRVGRKMLGERLRDDVLQRRACRSE
jgi:hypothetical protein